jgi:hypothetical protein
LTHSDVDPSGIGTECLTGLLTGLPASGTFATLLARDDASGAGYVVDVDSAGAVTVGTMTGGVITRGAPLGTIAARSLFRVATTINGGVLAGSLEGGPVQTATGGPVSGITTGRVGHLVGGGSGMGGEVAHYRRVRFPVPSGALSALCNRMPLT